MKNNSSSLIIAEPGEETAGEQEETLQSSLQANQWKQSPLKVSFFMSI